MSACPSCLFPSLLRKQGYMENNGLQGFTLIRGSQGSRAFLRTADTGTMADTPAGRAESGSRINPADAAAVSCARCPD